MQVSGSDSLINNSMPRSENCRPTSVPIIESLPSTAPNPPAKTPLKARKPSRPALTPTQRECARQPAIYQLAQDDKENLRPPGQSQVPASTAVQKPTKEGQPLVEGHPFERIQSGDKPPRPSPKSGRRPGRSARTTGDDSARATHNNQFAGDSAAPVAPASAPKGPEGSPFNDIETTAAAAAAEALRLRVAALERRLAEMSAAAQGSAARLRQQASALRESERRREADAAELRTARRKLGILRSLPPSAATAELDSWGGSGGAELSRHLAGLAEALAPVNGDAAAALALAAAALGAAERREAATADGLRELAALGQLEAGALERCRAALGAAAICPGEMVDVDVTA